MSAYNVQIGFYTDNAAFQDGDGPHEAASLIHEVADRIRAGHTSGVIHDSNGNKVGDWSAEFDEPEPEGDPRQKGDDDGQEYADPSDELRDRLERD